MRLNSEGMHCITIKEIHQRVNRETKCQHGDHDFQQKELGNVYSTRCVNCGIDPPYSLHGCGCNCRECLA